MRPAQRGERAIGQHHAARSQERLESHRLDTSRSQSDLNPGPSSVRWPATSVICRPVADRQRRSGYSVAPDALPVDATRAGHAAREENPDAFLDAQIGKHHPLPRVDQDVAEIQVIGRDVHRHQRLARRASRSSVNSRVRNPGRSRGRVLDQHHALEAVLVVGRERRHELLHRRVDGPEHRHEQQPCSARCSSRRPMTLVADRADESTSSAVVSSPARARRARATRAYERRREAIDDAEDPDERRHADDQRDGDEEAGDEAAAAARTSRQPDQPRPQAPARPAATAAERDAGTTRTRAKRVRRRYRRKYLTVDVADDGRHHDADQEHLRARRRPAARARTSEPFVRGGRGHRRHASRNENARRRVALEPAGNRPSVIVAPERDTPGTSASDCATPSAKRLAASAILRRRRAGASRTARRAACTTPRRQACTPTTPACGARPPRSASSSPTTPPGSCRR